MDRPSLVVDPAALSAWLQQRLPITLVDCRSSLSDPALGRREYDVGHLPGAVFADLERDLSGPVVPTLSGRHPLPTPDALRASLERWGITAETPVVAYDDGSGAYAPRLWWLLNWLGHRHVAVLNGGVRGWLAFGGELSTTPVSPEPGSFVPGMNSNALATLTEVEDAVATRNGATVLLDARGPARYRGDEEPIDRVAGHIPGALNLPFTSLYNASGVLPAEQVRALVQPLLGNAPAGQAIAYCGSGVTACSLIWAAATAGLTGIRLYPGSWSEWIQSPSHPIARSAHSG